MKALEKIYELWGETQSDTSDVIHKWCELNAYLYKVCPDSVRDNIETGVMEYGKLLEKQAFLAGFMQAFQIWAETYDSLKM